MRLSPRCRGWLALTPPRSRRGHADSACSLIACGPPLGVTSVRYRTGGMGRVQGWGSRRELQCHCNVVDCVNQICVGTPSRARLAGCVGWRACLRRGALCVSVNGGLGCRRSGAPIEAATLTAQNFWFPRSVAKFRLEHPDCVGAKLQRMRGRTVGKVC